MEGYLRISFWGELPDGGGEGGGGRGWGARSATLGRVPHRREVSEITGVLTGTGPGFHTRRKRGGRVRGEEGEEEGGERGHAQPWPAGAGSGFHTREEREAGVRADARSGVRTGQGRYGGPCVAFSRVNRGTPQGEGERAGGPQTQGLGSTHAWRGVRAGARTDV